MHISMHQVHLYLLSIGIEHKSKNGKRKKPGCYHKLSPSNTLSMLIKRPRGVDVQIHHIKYKPNWDAGLQENNKKLSVITESGKSKR